MQTFFTSFCSSLISTNCLMKLLKKEEHLQDILFRGDGRNDRLGKEMIHWWAVTTKKNMIHAIFCSHANPSPLHRTWQRRPPMLLPSHACTLSSHTMRREMPMLPPTRTYSVPISNTVIGKRHHQFGLLYVCHVTQLCVASTKIVRPLGSSCDIFFAYM
jgi:hypothetical protein